MNEPPPKLEVLPSPDKVNPQSPAIVVSEDEAAQICEELGLLQLAEDPSSPDAPKKKQVGFDVRKALRLGIFVEENAVRADNGKIFIADQILLTHLIRLNEKSKEMKSAKELAEIAYPIGYLVDKIKKSSKTKIVVEAVQGGAGRPSQASWEPGQKVLPPAASA